MKPRIIRSKERFMPLNPVVVSRIAIGLDESKALCRHGLQSVCQGRQHGVVFLLFLNGWWGWRWGKVRVARFAVCQVLKVNHLSKSNKIELSMLGFQNI